jgi:hypothetical protein
MVECQISTQIRDVDARVDTGARGRCSRLGADPIAPPMAFGADVLGEPATDGPAAASYLEAPPAPSNAGSQKMAIGVRVVQRSREPLRRFALCIAKNVARHIFSGWAFSGRTVDAACRMVPHFLTSQQEAPREGSVSV